MTPKWMSFVGGYRVLAGPEVPSLERTSSPEIQFLQSPQLRKYPGFARSNARTAGSQAISSAFFSFIASAFYLRYPKYKSSG
jgi:hypothetical protein